MTDVHDLATRSYNMSKIRSKDTKPELIVRKKLHALGYRYSLNKKSLPGKPDIVLKKYNTVIMIHGCFWHGHKNCKYFKLPKSNTEFWANKIFNNQERDIKNVKELKKLNWKVIEIWECQIRKNTDKVIHNIIKKLNK